MGFCSVCGSWVDEGDICGHCGNSGRYYEEEQEEEDDNYVSDYDYFYRQARTASIKGDHLSAIGFYKELLGLSLPSGKAKALSYIADEYEAIGDYASAEKYWERCCEVKVYNSYMYLAMKGDFLYRRQRYGEAIEAYEKSLDALRDCGEEKINSHMLEYYAVCIHYIIDSCNTLGRDNRKEEYHDEFKRAVKRYMNAEGLGDKAKAKYLSKIAWKLYENESMIEEPLILIDAAIELHGDDTHYMRKAIFLKRQQEINVMVKIVYPHDLDLINEALKILPDDCDSAPYLKVKADILDILGDRVKAKVCYCLAAGEYDKVDEADRQLKRLTPYATYINITGTQYYRHFEPFSEGTVVDLVGEPDNPHDSHAIRVEIKGETVGYVANSEYTLIKQVKSAADIKNFRFKRAEVMFILFDEWVIAKLI